MTVILIVQIAWDNYQSIILWDNYYTKLMWSVKKQKLDILVSSFSFKLNVLFL